ncbi:unnamed protein product [Urochloa humidicola]
MPPLAIPSPPLVLFLADGNNSRAASLSPPAATADAYPTTQAPAPLPAIPSPPQSSSCKGFASTQGPAPVLPCVLTISDALPCPLPDPSPLQ